MRKIICFALALFCLLCLCACGETEAPEKLALQALYEDFLPSMPEMLVTEDAMRESYLGVKSADCAQCICAITSEGLRADEIWLIEAVDAEALARLLTLAENRLAAKKEETSFHSPDQFAICEDGRIISSGLYMALIVSPEADTLEKAFRDAAE